MQFAPSTPISVLIADDHHLVAEILAAHLDRQEGFTAEIAESLATAKTRIASHGSYDLVLLDLHMPGMNGLAGLSEIVAANAGKPVVLLSGNLSAANVDEAMRLGAASCFPKTMPARSLINAIRFVVAGEKYLPVDHLVPGTVNGEPQQTLSRKELLVLKGISAGLTNKEIGREMKLSDVTIKMHVRSICAKLGARNRTQAAMIGNQKQIV